jgi:hypothetical protein
MKLIKDSISIQEIKKMAKQRFGNLVKAVIDIDKKVIVVDAELHADQESLLIQSGSQQANLWGINFYPEKYGSPDFIEFDSMINLRPSQNNLSRNIKNKKIQNKIRKIVTQLIKK